MQHTATLRVVGSDFDPCKVTEVMGVEPTEAYRKGEVVPHRSSRTRPTSYWGLETECGPDCSLDEHVARLLRRISVDSAGVETLRTLGLTVQVYCGVFGPDDMDLSFSPEVLCKLGRLNFALEVRIYRD